jgi:hypothetical protein
LKSVDFLISQEHRSRDVSWDRGSEQQLRTTLEPPISISASDQLVFHVHYYSYHIGGVKAGPKKSQYISIDIQTLLNALLGEGDTRELRQVDENIEIIILFSSGATAQGAPNLNPQTIHDPSLSTSADLVPQTDEITSTCPRFRILVIGKVYRFHLCAPSASLSHITVYRLASANHR